MHVDVKTKEYDMGSIFVTMVDAAKEVERLQKIEAAVRYWIGAPPSEVAEAHAHLAAVACANGKFSIV